VLATATNAFAAAPDCDSLPGTKIYIQAGDTQANLLHLLGHQLRDNTSRPLTLVWVLTGSCANIDLMYNHLPATGMAAAASYAASTSESPTWKITDTPQACTISTVKFPDIGNSALFTTACAQGQGGPPATVKLTTGPRQAYVLAMVRGTDQVAMTYEEAYFIFGFGPTLLEAMGGSIAPWLTETELKIRLPGKSTLLAWAANINVPDPNWHGTRFDKSTQVVNALLTSGAPSAALGILGAEVYDGLRDKLTILAYRAQGQYAAYYPDTTSSSRDKKNVRDGHYTVWSPTVWMENVTGSGAPVNDDAHFVIDLIAGHTVATPPNFQPNVTVAKVGLVPDCAMRVDRSYEGGPLSMYTPPVSCVCEFENAVDSSSCETCATQACSHGVCRNGYCEEF